MNDNFRWQILLAVLGFTLVAALLSYQQQVEEASTCTITEPAPGGTFSEGVVGAPQFLNPLLSDPNPIDQQLVQLIFDGLVRYDETGRLVPALARSWQISEDICASPFHCAMMSPGMMASVFRRTMLLLRMA